MSRFDEWITWRRAVALCVAYSLAFGAFLGLLTWVLLGGTP